MTTVSDYTALLSGSYWNGIEVTGKPVIVTYSFPTSAPAYDVSVDGFTSATVSSFQGFNANEQTQARAALGEWAAASGITFVEVAPGQGDINFQLVDLSTSAYGSPGGIGFYPFGDWNYFTYPSFSSDLNASGDVFMNAQYVTPGTNGTADGTVNYGTLLHEIGHALGLKHPTETVYSVAQVHDQTLDTGDDPTRTIMATVGDSSNTTPHILQLDKDAAAAIYGTSGGQVVTASASGSNTVSSWSWNAGTQTLTQTAVTSGETIRGSSVTDVITASLGGSNRLFGLNGNDTLVGGSGDDYLDGGPGVDSMTGGAGNDIYAVDNALDQVVEQANGGNDTVYAYVSYTLAANVETMSVFGSGLTGTGNGLDNTLFGDGVYATTINGMGGNDYIAGGRSGDVLNGGDGDDTIYGGAGNDIMIGGLGNNALHGDGGFDTADFSDVTAAMTITLGGFSSGGNNTGSYTAGSGTGKSSGSLLSIEHVRSGSGNDTITAGSGTPSTQGDLMKPGHTAASFDQPFDLDTGFRIKSDPSVANSTTIPHVTVNATSANFLSDGEYYAFSVVDPGSVVTLYASGVDDSYAPVIAIKDSLGNVLATQALSSGSGSLSYNFAASGQYYAVVEYTNTGNVVPTGDAYTLQLSLTNQYDEWIEAGAGNDTILASTGRERLDGGTGTDSVYFNRLSFGITASLATGTNGSYTLVNVENIVGTTLSDTLVGDGNANVLNDGGSGGADSMAGGGGNDTYYVNNSGDVITEAAGAGYDLVYSTVDYTLPGNVEEIRLLGTGNLNATGNDQGVTFYGNVGANILTGGAGNDIFGDGGSQTAADTMIGGGGNDTYYVSNSADVITEGVNGGTDKVLSTVSYTLGANIETLMLLGTGTSTARATIRA